jgi:hypothetical protein
VALDQVDLAVAARRDVADRDPAVDPLADELAGAVV